MRDFAGEADGADLNGHKKHRAAPSQLKK